MTIMARKDSAIDMNSAEGAVSPSTSDTGDVPALDLPQSRTHRLSVVTAAVSRQVRNIKASTPRYPLVKFVLKKRTGNGAANIEPEVVSPPVAQSVSAILNRPLTALKWLGLRHVPKDRKSSLNLSFLYSCAVLLAVLINFGRLCGGYTLNDDIQVMSTQILYHIFAAQVTFTVIVFVFGTTPRLIRFLNRYEKYREVNNENTETVTTDHATNLVKRTFTGICILLLSPVIVEALSYFLLPWLTARASRPFKYYSANVAAYVPWHIILCFINTVPICFIFVVCRLLQHEFSAINILFRKTLAGKPDSERLELVRLRHATLLEVVTSLDDAISPYILLTCVCDVSLLAFHSSVLTFNDISLTSHRAIFVIARLISCLCVATHFFGLISSAVPLTNTTKSSRHLIRKINTLNQSDVEFKILQTFSMTMTYDHIGLTALKVFDITRTSVTVMTTLCVSYIVCLVSLRLTWYERKCEVSY